jgi:hypothetical protein
MSQHDLNIANQGFPAFRADLNNALVALGSTNSGATAPATAFANQLWYDTANNILKIRNEDNDAWISLLTLDQVADAVSAIGSISLSSISDVITNAVTLAGTQTLTNKTLTNPVINGFTGNTAVVNIGSGQFYKNTSGNIGIATIPQTWYLDSSVYGALQFGSSALFYGRTTASSVNLELSVNSYLDSSAAYRYLFTGEASRYNQASGAHVWSSAVSGTAGNSFTYTERMRLTAAGLLQFNSGYGSVATAYGCRAWVNFAGTGTPAIRSSGNVSSITDNGTGLFTVNFTTAMPDANYSVSGTASSLGATASYTHVVTTGDSGNNYGGFSTTSVRLNVYGANYSALGDPEYVMACIFR